MRWVLTADKKTKDKHIKINQLDQDPIAKKEQVRIHSPTRKSALQGNKTTDIKIYVLLCVFLTYASPQFGKIKI